MPDKTWKRVERSIADRLGGRRTGVLAQWGCRGVPDVEAPGLAVEVKTRRRLPAWLLGALLQAGRAAKATHRRPVVVLHQLGSHHTEDLVLLRLADFEDLRMGHSEPSSAGSAEAETGQEER